MPPTIAPDPPLAEQLARAITAFAERHDLAHQGVDRRRVPGLANQLIDHRTEPEQTSTNAAAFDEKGLDKVVGGGVGLLCCLFCAHDRHHMRMPFCACKRFSASSQTTDCGPSMTS